MVHFSTTFFLYFPPNVVSLCKNVLFVRKQCLPILSVQLVYKVQSDQKTPIKVFTFNTKYREITMM